MLINGSNLIWFYKFARGQESRISDLLCDVFMVSYQVLESVVDMTWPHLTSSLSAALTHHSLTAIFMLFMRWVPVCPQFAHITMLSKHEVVLAGELQNLPRMLTRIMPRGSRAHTLTSHVSDVLLVIRLICWPLIPFRWIFVTHSAGCLSSREVIAAAVAFPGHFVVYLQQITLFQRDVVRLYGTAKHALGTSKTRRD